MESNDILVTPEQQKEAEALHTAIKQSLLLHGPADVPVEKLLQRFASMAMQVAPTRTSIIGAATWVAAMAFGSALTKEQIVAIVSEVFDATTQVEAIKKSNATYLQRNSEAKAMKQSGAQLVPGSGQVH